MGRQQRYPTLPSVHTHTYLSQYCRPPRHLTTLTNMIGRTVGITAACALGASALILPPGIAPEHREQLSDLSTTIHDPKSQIHTISCSECAFPDASDRVKDAAEEDDLFWIQGGAKSLVLNFTVSDDGKALQMNGGNIYPPTFQQDVVDKCSLLFPSGGERDISSYEHYLWDGRLGVKKGEASLLAVIDAFSQVLRSFGKQERTN